VSSDPFADILRLTEAKSVFSGGLIAGGAWAYRFRSRGKLKFYAVAEGGCWLRVEGQRKPLRLEQGDVLLLSGPKAFVVAGSLTAPPRESCPVFENGGTVARIGDRPECALLSGVVSLHPSSAELLTSALPAVVHVRAASPDSGPLRWMIERIEQERRSGIPGAEFASAQLAQLVFLQALRAQLTGPAVLPPGWLRALRDERLHHALRLMHDAPGRAWTVGELAKAAAMSRARFAARFKSAAGVAPLAYLTQLRMRIAQRRLREDAASIVEISASLGYQSESAFSHAFKRVTGTGPRAYRNAEAARGPAPQRDDRASLRYGHADPLAP
jgi:AraC-like DNA-binding protein